MNTIKTKRCSKCGRELPTDNFYRDNRAKDGLYSWCKECHSKYYQTYKQTNKQYLNQYNNQYQKQYYKQFKGYYLYIILDKQDEVVYVGQTTNYYTRLCHHLSGGVNSTKELFTNNEWAYIKYLDVGDIVANEMELKVLENMLIEIYEPKLNKAKNIIRDVSNDRLFSLIATLHNMNQEWKVFRVNK